MIEMEDKPRDDTKAGSDGRGTGSRSDILGDRVETDRNVLDKNGSAASFRGDVTLSPPSGDSAGDRELLRTARDVCAPKAIGVVEDNEGIHLTLDRGRCIMCGMCQATAPTTFKVQSSYAQPARRLANLVQTQFADLPSVGAIMPIEEIGKQLSEKVKRTLGRSLAIREVDAASCNGCEVEVAALNNPIYDVERFGVHFVASPRHADVLLVTGVCSRNMDLALRRTYDATPDPKIVVAVGACACTGGLFGDTYATSGGISQTVPVDVFVPGCPPRPEAILYGLLLAVDRIG